MLKAHLDKYVVGQDKAKKVTSVALYNHYTRIREIKRREADEKERKKSEERAQYRDRERGGYPTESE